MAVTDRCTTIINRALEPMHLKGDYIDRALVPLVPELCKLAAKHQQSIASPVFTAIFRKIMSTWTDTVVGPKPPDPSVLIAAIKQWLCSCATCAAVRTFLTLNVQRSQTWPRIGAPTRRHVEGFLSKHARAAATWETVRSSPQGITVNKADSLVGSVQWLINPKKGAKLLLTISKDTAELKTILGADYARILTALKAPLRPTAAATSAASGSGSDSTGQAMQNVPAASNASIRAPAATIAPTAKCSLASMSSASTSIPNAGGPLKKQKK
ncbi:hypothetical protein B0H21DRAFT_838291 [Amylocystis lapponica]|nr:hypothetical protein B0H21DRAFT_838291 [Amylocystis lapponica]